MPISLQVDDSSKAVVATVLGNVSFEEILDHLKSKAENQLFSYAELVDLRDVQVGFAKDDMQRLAGVVRDAMGGSKAGPIAVVTNNGFIHGLATAYRALAVEHNPVFKVFTDIHQAKAWLLQRGHQF